MKKKTIINFVVIVGLLIMSIVTLMAVYSTAPETILLFEENFENLDEKKWERHTRDCRVKSGLHKYGSNSSIDDGVLLFEPLFVEGRVSDMEKYIENCNLCTRENSTNADCVQRLSTMFKTKNSFQAKHGKVEVRLKLPLDNSLKACKTCIFTTHHKSHSSITRKLVTNFAVQPEFLAIGIALSNATSEYENSLEGFRIIETVDRENKNGSTEFKLFFGPPGNQTFMERKVTKADFHVYEFEWVNDYVEFKIDGVKAMKFQLDKMKNSTLREDEFFGRPFYLYFDIHLQEKNGVAAEEFLNLFKNSTSVESIVTNRSSSRSGSNRNATNNGALIVDYVKLYKKIE